MSWKSRVRSGVVGLVLAGCAFPCIAQDTPAPDNTKVNKRNRNKAEATADQAKENQSDRQLMQQIRKAVMADKSLSTYGHNVKIIAQSGKVTLKGPVKSQGEKSAIEAKAVEVAGSGNVTNELTVAPDGGVKSNSDQ